MECIQWRAKFSMAGACNKSAYDILYYIYIVIIDMVAGELD